MGFSAFFAASLFFAFLAGCIIVLAQVWPYKFLDNAYRAGWALLAQQHAIEDPFTQTDQWRPARTKQRGVTRYDAGRANNGHTLTTAIISKTT